MTRRRVRVTDHALVRFLERAGGFDIERLRKEIEKKVYRSAPDGATGIKVDGVQFVIVEDGAERVVTTVMEANWYNHGPKCAGGQKERN
jgi:hypothetical protein